MTSVGNLQAFGRLETEVSFVNQSSSSNRLTGLLSLETLNRDAMEFVVHGFKQRIFRRFVPVLPLGDQTRDFTVGSHIFTK